MRLIRYYVSICSYDLYSIANGQVHEYVPWGSCIHRNSSFRFRPPRHLAARVVISTQELTVSTDLLNLCSVTFVHRFTSPEWLRTLQKHLAAAAANPVTSPAKPGNTTHDTGESSADQNLSSLFDNVVQLRIGEALLFAPSAIWRPASDKMDDSSSILLGPNSSPWKFEHDWHPMAERVFSHFKIITDSDSKTRHVLSCLIFVTSFVRSEGNGRKFNDQDTDEWGLFPPVNIT